MKTTDLIGNHHFIKSCTEEDVSKHFACVEKYIIESDRIPFQNRMRRCIAEGTAFALTDDTCFIYYMSTTKHRATGIALFGEGVPMKMIALFTGVFREIDKDTFAMEFRLHPGKMLNEYKSLLTLTSIKRHANINYPLMIRIDRLKEKIHELHTARGITWEM